MLSASLLSKAFLTITTLFLAVTTYAEGGIDSAVRIVSTVGIKSAVGLDSTAGTDGKVTFVESQVFGKGSFIQGYELAGGSRFISSGLYQKSYIARVSNDFKTIEKVRRLPAKIFAEGLTVYNNRVFSLTWRAGLVYVLNKDDLELVGQFHYKGEGWGLAHSDKYFYMSNGSHQLQKRSLEDFSLQSSFTVQHDGKALSLINELEFAQGYIWANTWQSPYIYKIDADSGLVLRRYDLTELVEHHQGGDSNAVLNGIAYDTKRQAFWITGKTWQAHYLVKLD
ncbi:MAG: glutamine cyclotransferase [Flavobacteriales bacterium]|jgi:glutamine cyclotransferase